MVKLSFPAQAASACGCGLHGVLHAMRASFKKPVNLSAKSLAFYPWSAGAGPGTSQIAFPGLLPLGGARKRLESWEQAISSLFALRVCVSRIGPTCACPWVASRPWVGSPLATRDPAVPWSFTRWTWKSLDNPQHCWILVPQWPECQFSSPSSKKSESPTI